MWIQELYQTKTRDISFIKDFNTILKRGPDGEGVWYSEDFKVCFFHTRLAIQFIKSSKSTYDIKSNRYIL